MTSFQMCHCASGSSVFHFLYGTISPPTQFIRVGMLSMLFGAAIVSGFESFSVLAIGMAFLGAGMALCMPSVSAGASLAVAPGEQGATAGLVSSCPAIGFVLGPVCAGALYQVHSPLAPLFSAAVFFVVLLIVVLNDRPPGP